MSGPVGEHIGRLMSDVLAQAQQDAAYWLGAFKAEQAECNRLRRLNESLINARAAAAEVLSRKANRLPLTCPHCQAEIRWGWEDEPCAAS